MLRHLNHDSKNRMAHMNNVFSWIRRKYLRSKDPDFLWCRCTARPSARQRWGAKFVGDDVRWYCFRKTRKSAAPKSESAVLLRIGKTEEALVRVKLPCSVYIMGRCVIEHLRLLTSSANFIRKVARTSLFLEELHSIFFTQGKFICCGQCNLLEIVIELN